MNPFDFNAANQSDIQIRSGVTRQRSVPVDIQVQHGMIHQQPPQQQMSVVHQQQLQSNSQQRQMQQQSQQMHPNQQLGNNTSGMMVNASNFEMPSTSLHRTQSATEPNNFANNSMLSSSMSLHNYNIHQNDDQSMFSSIMMDRPNSQMPSSQLLSGTDNQYEMNRNTSSTDNLSIYGTSRGEVLDTPVFGVPIGSHLSMDANAGQQSIGDLQRPMSLPPYANQQQGQQTQPPDQSQWW